MDTVLFQFLSRIGGLDSSEESSTYEVRDGSFFQAGQEYVPWQVVTQAESAGLITLENRVPASVDGGRVTLATGECHITDKGAQALVDEYAALNLYTIDLRDYRGSRSMTAKCPQCHKDPVHLYPAEGGGPKFCICSCGWLGIA